MTGSDLLPGFALSDEPPHLSTQVEMGKRAGSPSACQVVGSTGQRRTQRQSARLPGGGEGGLGVMDAAGAAGKIAFLS